MNADERRIACGCEHQVLDSNGGADGGRTHDLRIANATSVWRQVAVAAAKVARNTADVTSAFSRSRAAARRF